MALAEIDTSIQRGAVQSFENQRERKKEKRRALHLTESEILELRELWGGFASQIGFRSVHGAVEARMLRSPPREYARRHVIVELQRCGGRCSEARLMRELMERPEKVLEVGLQRYELRKAIRHLIERGRVERIDVPGDPPTKDLRIRQRGDLTMRLALASVPKTEREDRWHAQDEAIRLMWATIEVKDDDGGRANYEPAGSWSAVLGRSLTKVLESMSRESVAVLRAAYGTSESAHGGLYGKGLGHVAAMTSSVLQEREQLARALTKGRTSKTRTAEELHELALRQVRPEDVLRDRIGDAAFRAVVAAEADEMLVRACSEFRKARFRG